MNGNSVVCERSFLFVCHSWLDPESRIRADTWIPVSTGMTTNNIDRG